jgi:hypothetical protein
MLRNKNESKTLDSWKYYVIKIKYTITQFLLPSNGWGYTSDQDSFEMCLIHRRLVLTQSPTRLISRFICFVLLKSEGHWSQFGDRLSELSSLCFHSVSPGDWMIGLYIDVRYLTSTSFRIHRS